MDDLFKEIPSLKRFLGKTRAWMTRRFDYDYHEMYAAGVIAIYEAYRDGEISNNGKISVGAKRFIRRRMAMSGAQDTTRWKVPKIDYGYQDGRMAQRGVRVSAHDKHSHWRQRNRTKGLCERCGKKPETERVLCNGCTEKVNKRRRHSTEMTRKKVIMIK